MIEATNKIIYYISIVIFIILVLTAIIAYSNYGKGIGYAVFIVFPAISIGIGLLAKWTSKWWVILAVICIAVTCYIVSVSARDIIGFIPYLFVYIILGCGVGINSRYVAKYSLHKNHNGSE